MMKLNVRDALKRARHELDGAIEILESAEFTAGDDEDLAEVRARLHTLETRVSVIEEQRRDP